MNKSALIGKISDDAGISKTAASNAVDSLIHGITGSLRKGQRVTLSGFGTFAVSKRKARTENYDTLVEELQPIFL